MFIYPVMFIHQKIIVDSISLLVNDQITLNDSVILTGDTSINGRCNMSNNLQVLGTSEFGKTMSKQTPSQGGEIYELNLLLIIKNHLQDSIIELIYELH